MARIDSICSSLLYPVSGKMPQASATEVVRASHGGKQTAIYIVGALMRIHHEFFSGAGRVGREAIETHNQRIAGTHAQPLRIPS